jgi:plastocyanin
VSKRLTTSCAILAVFAAACATQPSPAVDYGAGTRFVPQVVDSLDDVGIGPSVAITADGLPYVSYLGFPAVLKPNEIPTQRPVGAPFLPAVLLSNLNADGIWIHGAVVQTKPDSEPNGITVPFGPQTVANLGLTKNNTNGTAVAVGDNGTIHVAWTQADGVWYASTTDGGTSTVSQVFNYGVGVSIAGPIGRPDVALDDNGDPWVAFAVNGATGIEIRVATPDGESWKAETVATGTTCNGCPQPGPAAIANLGGKPVVAFADPGGSRVVIAASDGTTWTTQDLKATKDVSGVSIGAVGSDAVLAYYAGGKVELATDAGGAWQATDVATADLGDAADARGNLAPTTGVAAGKDAAFVAWQDTSGVHLASGSGGTFDQLDTGAATQGGTSPSLAVDGDGNAYVAWYDATNGNLMLGVYGDVGDVVIANPSPSLEPSAGGGAAECGKDKKIQLDIIAKGTAFDPTCLVAAAGKGFTISFDDQDDAATTGQHNIAIFKTAADATNISSALFTGDLVTGPAKVPYDVQALDSGSYFFHCNVHPTMTGTLAVVQGAK